MTRTFARRMALACALTIPAFTAAMAQANPPAQARVAASGREEEISFWYSVEPDCSSPVQPEIRIVKAPSNGVLRVAKAEKNPSFAKDNVRAACNARKVPATVVYYQSVHGFTGKDQAIVEVVFASGNVRSFAYDVSVRP